VLAATNIDIHEAVENGTFREDLFYRLNAFTVEIPPLRERRQEIPFLVDHFVSEFALKYGQAPPQYSEKLIHACAHYRWPGNLRELGNFIKRFVVFQDEAMAIAELNEKTRELKPGTVDAKIESNSDTGLKSMMKDLKHSAEVKVIEEALISTNWNRKRAALKLQISCKALRYKIKQYQLTPLPQV